MNSRFRALKPIPLTFIFFAVGLLCQLVFPSQTTISSFGETETVRSFGLGWPVRIISIGDQTSVKIQWAVLLLNLAGSYLLAAILATAISKATYLRFHATAYGLVALSMIGLAFIVSITISKLYWGYFFKEPPLLSEVAEITEVRAIVWAKTSDASGKPTLIADDTASLMGTLASAKKYADDALSSRILLELDRRRLIPPTFSQSLAGLPELYDLIQNSGELVNSSPGYNSSSQLHGLVVDAIGRAGDRFVFACVQGGQLSDDHYPYYELLFRGQPSVEQLNFVRGQHYFYDAAGMEGFEWYVIWPFLAIPAILVGFLLFTLLKTIPKTEANPV